MNEDSAQPDPDSHATGRSSRVQLPLWLQWVLALIAFGALAAGALAIYRNGTSDEPSGGGGADAEGRIVVEQDQAPHSVRLSSGASPRQALERAIADDVRLRVRRRELVGPLQVARCDPRRSPNRARRSFRCAVLAGNVRYPFVGVAELRTGRLTWCKHDPAPEPGLDVPLSRRCRP